MRIAFLICFIFFTLKCVAQITFERVYNTMTENEQAIGCEILHDKYFIAGNIVPCGLCVDGTGLILIDSIGNVLGSHNYPLNADAYGSILYQAGDNEFYVLGQIVDFNYDMFVSKFDSTGTMLWFKQFSSDTIGSIIPKSICSVDDSTLFIDYISFGEGSRFMIMNSDGDSIGRKIIGLPFHAGVHMTRIHDGNLAILATKYDTTNVNFSIVKIDKSGDTLWTHDFRRDTLGVILQIIETADSGFAVTGNINNSINHNPLCILKFDSLGNSLWCKPFFTGYTENFSSISLCFDGGFITSGVTLDPSNHSRGFLYRTNANGDSMWFKEYETGYPGFMQSANQTADGGFIASGTIGAYNGLPPSIIIIKTDSLGNVASVLGTNNIIAQQEPIVYPNPSSNKIRISTDCRGPGRITVTDMLSVERMQKQFGKSEDIELNIQDLSIGFYFIKIETNCGTWKKQFIKV